MSFRLMPQANGNSCLRYFAIIALIALLAAIPAFPAQAQWAGKEESRDGVVHVMNPATGMESRKTAELNELWRIGGDTDDEDEFFGVISTILTDEEGLVYLLDSQLNTVKIYGPTGEFIREIGREGEGPGEFRGAASMFFTADGHVGVLQVAPGKIVLLTKDGVPAGEHPLPEVEGQGFIILIGGQYQAGNLVLHGAQNAFVEGQFDQTRYLTALSPEGKETVRYHSEVRTIVMADAKLVDKEWDTFDRRWTVGSDGRVYACTSYDDYEIRVWNADGTPDRVIHREYSHRKRTQEEIDVMTQLMGLFANQIPGATVDITDVTKDVDAFYVREDGSVWVLTSDGSRDQPEGTVGVFDVFDAKGRFVREVALAGQGDPQLDGYYFVKDRLYVVTDLVQAAISLQAGGQSFDIGDEEPEPMSVICYQLADDVLSLNK